MRRKGRKSEYGERNGKERNWMNMYSQLIRVDGILVILKRYTFGTISLKPNPLC